MPFYHVGSNAIELKKGLTQDNFLASLDEDYDPSNPNPDGTVFIFDNLDAAIKFAKWGVEPKAKKQFPIFEVELADKAKKNKEKYPLLDDNDEEIDSVNGFKVSETDVTIVNVSFPHVNKAKPLAIEIELADVEASASNEEEASASNEEEASASNEEEASASNEEEASASDEEEVKKDDAKKKPTAKKDDKKGKKADNKDQGLWSKIVATSKSMLPHVAIPGAIGSGFYLSGAVTPALQFLSGLVGTTITASLLPNVVVSAVVGLAGYGLGLGVYHGGNYLVGAAKNVHRNMTRTAKEKHDDEVKSLQKQVSELEKKLKFKDDSSIVVNFNERVKKAPDDKFAKDGKLDKAAPENRGKVFVLKWEVEKLKAMDAAKEGKDRNKLVEQAKKERLGPRSRS